MVITGNIDEIASYQGPFATLSTDDIFCEMVADGYNSSVILYEQGIAQHLYKTLQYNYSHLLKFLMRFDHYLEMLVWNADLVQVLFKD